MGHASSAVGRELERLQNAGVLRSQSVGRSRVYELDLTSPVVKELRPLVQRTVGAEALLQQAFDGLEGIEEAFIYGSFGTPSETPRSDIDVLVIGRPTERMWERVVAVERKLGREINVKHYTATELGRLRRAGSEFVRSAYAGRRATLIGRHDNVS